MARGTPATQALTKAGIAYELAEYDYAPGAERVGLQAAEAMGVSPGTGLQDPDDRGRRQAGLRHPALGRRG